MAEHNFLFVTTASTWVTVESDLPREQAEELAWDKVDASLCHQCSRKAEFGDWELSEEQEDQ